MCVIPRQLPLASCFITVAYFSVNNECTKLGLKRIIKFFKVQFLHKAPSGRNIKTLWQPAASIFLNVCALYWTLLFYRNANSSLRQGVFLVCLQPITVNSHLGPKDIGKFSSTRSIVYSLDVIFARLCLLVLICVIWHGNPMPVTMIILIHVIQQHFGECSLLPRAGAWC